MECRGGTNKNLPWEDDGSVSVLINDGSGLFLDRNIYLNGGLKGLADFDNDGFLDYLGTYFDTDCVVMTHQDGSTTSSCEHKTLQYFGNGKSHYPFNYVKKFSGALGSTCVADFDNDGNLDIATIGGKWEESSNSDDHSSVKILFGNGSGDFSLREYSYDNLSWSEIKNHARKIHGEYKFYSDYKIPEHPGVLECGDFNGDGYSDIVVANWRGENEITVLINNGSGVFINGDLYHGGHIFSAIPINYLPTSGSADWRDVVTYDFNSDGILDIAATNERAGTVEILLGEGGFIVPSTVEIISPPTYGTLVNRDGKITYQLDNSWLQTGFPPHVDKDFFEYTVKDSNGLESNVATVTIPLPEVYNGGDPPIEPSSTSDDDDSNSTVEPVYGAPVALPDLTEEIQVGSAGNFADPVTVDVLANDYDPGFHLFESYAIGGKPYGLSITDVNPALPDLKCSGSLEWQNAEPGSELTGSISLLNIGTPETDLNWQIIELPDWPSLTITPMSGMNLKPEDEAINLQVSVNAPAEEGITISGIIKIANSEDPGDYCELSITITTIDDSEPNEAPEADDDTVATDENATIVIGVLDNDDDPDGNVDPATVEIIDDPDHGSIDNINELTGEITYTPESGYNGPDSFTYSVKDNDGAESNTATVTIIVGDYNAPAEIRNEIPDNSETGVEIDLGSLAFEIYDFEGNSVTWSVETSPDIGSAYGVDESPEAKSCDITTILDYETSYTWYVNVTDSGSGVTTSEVFTFTTKSELTPEVKIKIKSPVAGGIYLKNKHLITTKLPFAVIIGGIDLEIEVENPDDVDINNLTIYIDNKPLETVIYNPLNSTYIVNWDERAIGMNTISAVLTDYDDEEINVDAVDVFVINLALGKR